MMIIVQRPAILMIIMATHLDDDEHDDENDHVHHDHHVFHVHHHFHHHVRADIMTIMTTHPLHFFSGLTAHLKT